MNKFTNLFILPLVSFLIGVASTILYFNATDKQVLKIQNPHPKWETGMFITIDKYAMKADLPDLRRVLLPRGDFEVRIWIGFGVTGEDGFILRYSANKWSAIHLQGIPRHPQGLQSKIILPAPKHGWENMWRRLIDAELLTLPDGEDLNCDPGFLDGLIYIIEINKDRVYRTYHYSNPRHSECIEAKKVLAIGKIIGEEFGLEVWRLVTNVGMVGSAPKRHPPNLDLSQTSPSPLRVRSAPLFRPPRLSRPANPL
jgi:hypothetical protein